MRRKSLAGLACPQCAAIIPPEAAQVDNVGICPACDTVLELEGRRLRIIPGAEILELDLAVKRELAALHRH